MHFLPAPSDEENPASPRVAFAVSKAVGGSVVRHRVVRRLRQVISEYLTEMPAGCTVVVRALPSAATATSAELAEDLDALIPRVTGACA